MSDLQPTSPHATPLQPRRRWLKGKRLAGMAAAVLLLLVMSNWPVVRVLWYRASGQWPAKDSIPWRLDYAAALAESAHTGKPVLLDFSASWCPPCQAMKHDVWPDPRVNRAVVAGFIPIALDADAPSTAGPATRYSVDAIPHVLIVDSAGTVLRDRVGYLSADETLEFLKLPAGG